MKPILQTEFLTQVGHGAGNCLQAAYASLLGKPLEFVPNFMEVEDDHERVVQERIWFADHGYFNLCIDNYGDFDFAGEHVAIGPNARDGIMHAVVYRGNKLIHDPHPKGGGLANVLYRIFLIPKKLS